MLVDVKCSEPHIIDRYKMSLYICCGRYSVSVAFCLMTGGHDEYNQWPFSKPVFLIIIQPDDNNRNYKKTLTRRHGFDNFITIKKPNEGGYVKQETLILITPWLRF